MKIVFALLLMSPLLFITSCSSDPDPCEMIECVNGSCDDGSCLCDEGWTGLNCQQADYSGDYIMIGYTTIDCPDLFFTDIQGSGDTRMLCGKAEDFDVCYENSWLLNKDMTYLLETALFLHNDDGSVETIFDTNERGTWRVESNQDIRTTATGSTGFRMMKLLSDGKREIIGPDSNGGLVCKIKEVYLRL